VGKVNAKKAKSPVTPDGATGHEHEWREFLRHDNADRTKTLTVCDCGAVRWSTQAKHLEWSHSILEKSGRLRSARRAR
jgi:hypothetical protein